MPFLELSILKDKHRGAVSHYSSRGEGQCVSTHLCLCLPLVLPFLQADGHCCLQEVSQRRVLAYLFSNSDHSL